jgi:signal peptidase
MPLAVTAIRIVRRTLDILLLLLIAVVLATVLVARVVPAVTGGTTFVVGGGSMEPSLPLGSAVVALPVTADQLRVGDIVSLRVGPERVVFTHRITRLVTREDGLWIATRGDANRDADPSLTPVTAVIGRVDGGIPYLGFLIAVLSTAPGVVFLVSAAGFLLAGAWLLETFEDDRRLAYRRAAPLPGTPVPAGPPEGPPAGADPAGQAMAG